MSLCPREKGGPLFALFISEFGSEFGRWFQTVFLE
jgi:hypothetical protein